MTVRTLIVDDSQSMQRLLQAVLSGDPEIEVVGMAEDPFEARAMIKELNPDVITLDIEMPRMDGLSFLQKLMALRPMPVVMISSHTGKGTELSVEALAQGAFCCLPKPRIDNEEALTEICEMVKQAASASTSIARNRSQTAAPKTEVVKSGGGEPDLIVIGSSTGGVEALSEVFSSFPADCPPTVVTQHMPAAFTKSLAGRLDRLCKPTVMEAQNREALKPGHIYIAPGGVGHTTISNLDVIRTRINPGEPVGGHMPAVDTLFESVTSCRGLKTSAAILTGMGSDGANGLLKLKECGARTISQNEETSLVYGMPAAANKLGAAQYTLPIHKIADALINS